jgi:hypothetical protein
LKNLAGKNLLGKRVNFTLQSSKVQINYFAKLFFNLTKRAIILNSTTQRLGFPPKTIKKIQSIIHRLLNRGGPFEEEEEYKKNQISYE